MKKRSPWLLFTATAMVVLSAESCQASHATPLVPPTEESLIAQLFYPPANEQRIIAVSGQGRANAPADLAQVDFTFVNEDPAQKERESPPTEQTPETPTPEPITEASLQPILKHILKQLVALGIPVTSWEVTVNPAELARNQSYGEAALTVILEQPTQAKLKQMVKAVSQALPSQGSKQAIFLGGVSVEYAVKDCEALEKAAYGAAMEDAKLRAKAIALSMGVELRDLPSVAELPFLGRFISPCTQTKDIIGAIFGRSPSPYDPKAPAEVVVYREVAVTYQVK